MTGACTPLTHRDDVVERLIFELLSGDDDVGVRLKADFALGFETSGDLAEVEVLGCAVAVSQEIS